MPHTLKNMFLYVHKHTNYIIYLYEHTAGNNY